MSSIRFVPTAVHAIFEYVGGIFLIDLHLPGFAGMGGVAAILPIVLGAGLILYSLLTNYELGVPALKVIPMSVHLTADFVASAFLALAPFLFGYSNQGLNVWLPQVIAGVAVMLLVLVSKTHPQPSEVRAKSAA